MDEILDFIKEHKLVKRGDVVGVGVSGGIDSMCLIHYLNSVKEQLDIEVVGIHINHGIREESYDEARFFKYIQAHTSYKSLIERNSMLPVPGCATNFFITSVCAFKKAAKPSILR